VAVRLQLTVRLEGNLKLSKRQLGNALNALAKFNRLAAIERDKIMEHCELVYGVTPGDIDNDDFIDQCDGGCGSSNGMSADDFDRSMRERMDRHGIDMPNAKLSHAHDELK
jgi:hypothetical protein